VAGVERVSVGAGVVAPGGCEPVVRVVVTRYLGGGSGLRGGYEPLVVLQARWAVSWVLWAPLDPVSWGLLPTEALMLG